MAMMRPPTDMICESRTLEGQGGSHNFNMDNGTSPKTKGSVQVKLELGHKALTRKRATTEGFTHDWTMFVRGPEGSNIQHYVDRVVFYLHDSFPKPKRVVKEPPYQINESGYAGFNLPIEIYFKNKDDPKKIAFSYDLFLHTQYSPPVNHVRCEKLTFQEPSEDFRRKLLKAGGIAILGPNDQQGQTPGVTQTASYSPSQSHTPESKEFADLFGAVAKAESRKTSKTNSPKGLPKSEATTQKKHKSNSSKDRSASQNKSYSSSHGSNPSPPTPPSTISPIPTTPPKEQQIPRPHSSNSSSKHSTKRAAESQPVENSKKKRKEVGTPERSKESSEKKAVDSAKIKETEEKEKKDKEKEKERKKAKKSSSKESKIKHKSSKKASKVTEPRSTKKSSPLKSLIVPVAEVPLASLPVSEPTVAPILVKTLAAKKQPPLSLQISDDLPLGEISGFDDMDLDIPADLMAEVCSPASTLSFISVKGPSTGDGGGPLGALFAEMDDDEGPLSPLPLTSDSPPTQQTPIPPPQQIPIPPPQQTPIPPPPPPQQTPISPPQQTPISPPQQTPISPPQQTPIPPPQILQKPPKINIGSPTVVKDPVVPVSPPQEQHKDTPSTDIKPVPTKIKKREKESKRSRTERRTKEASKENKDVSKETSKETSKVTNKDIIAKDLFRDYRSENVASTGECPKATTTAAKDALSTNADLGERELNNTNLQGQQPGMVAPNGESLNVLLELQHRLMGMTDRDLVQQVVNVIEETGMYKISDATFDFDLCSLDIFTVKKLQVCLEMS